LKDKPYVALAYMTGILPIKKYGTHSTLNMFSEYSMTNPMGLAPYYGFTEDEVRSLCARFKMDYNEVSAAYNGYKLRYYNLDAEYEESVSMFSPKSVVQSMLAHNLENYWNQTETYEALAVYIKMNLDGLRDTVVELMAGNSIKIAINVFGNDLDSFIDKDAVLTLLVHLGYLSYDPGTREVRIPNTEVSEAFITAVKSLHWKEVVSALKESERLLEDIWAGNNEAVAAAIDKAHEEVSILDYNNEKALSYTLGLALYYARSYYTVIRGLPSGKGFCDIAYIPRKAHAEKPAMVVELKVDKGAEGALKQIRDKNYPKALAEYADKPLLLAGISYNKRSKKHKVSIETFDKIERVGI
jgi:hypothetical protein